MTKKKNKRIEEKITVMLWIGIYFLSIGLIVFETFETLNVNILLFLLVNVVSVTTIIQMIVTYRLKGD